MQPKEVGLASDPPGQGLEAGLRGLEAGLRGRVRVGPKR